MKLRHSSYWTKSLCREEEEGRIEFPGNTEVALCLGRLQGTEDR